MEDFFDDLKSEVDDYLLNFAAILLFFKVKMLADAYFDAYFVEKIPHGAETDDADQHQQP